MQWTAWRSNRDRSLHLIVPGESFEDLPQLVRQLGPWHATQQGALSALRPLYRAQIAVWGFAFAYREAKDLKPTRAAR